MHTRAVAALGVALFLSAVPVLGQQPEDDRGFSTQNFQVAPGYGSFLTVEGAQVPQGLAFRLGALFDYQHRPLLIRGCAREEGGACVEWSGDEVPLIEHHLMGEVYGAISFFQVFEAAVVVPAVLYQSGEDVVAPDGTVAVESPGSAAGLDDVRLHLKLDLLHTFGYEGDTVGLALVPVVSFPVGNAIASDSFMGDSFLTFHPALAFGLDFDRVRLGLNGGYLWRQDKEFYLAEVGPRITYGAATEIVIVGGLSGIIEVFGQNGISADVASSPLESDGAIRYTWESGVALTIGGGGGIIGGVGNPMFRVFAGLVWAPPTADRDGDGILDDDDACPDDPEDKDTFEDADGCPDPDNDGDGILDKADACPLEKEVVNGVDDDDGCPDEALVEVREERIVISDKINFKTNSDKIVGAKSFEILDAVAKVIESKPDIRVRVEGHTDSRGKREYNLKLSKRRAAAVKRYLVKKGIADDRLETEGLGPDKPIDTNTSAEGRAENRRVEFHILGQ